MRLIAWSAMRASTKRISPTYLSALPSIRRPHRRTAALERRTALACSRERQAHSIAAPPTPVNSRKYGLVRTLTAERISFKHGLHLGGETVESGPHVGDSCGQPHAGSGRQANGGRQHQQAHRARPRTILIRVAMGVSVLKRSRTSPHSTSYVLPLSDDGHAGASGKGSATATGSQLSAGASGNGTSGMPKSPAR